MTLRNIAKQIAPPIVWQGAQEIARRLRSLPQRGVARGVTRLQLVGDYSSWAEAQHDSSGYDADVILARTLEAILKVKRGEATYERDSVLFDEVQYAWPVLAGLMWAAALNGGQLDVLDFGGSLGSSYFQNRDFLKRLGAVRWNIVEQARHVETGRRDLQDERLRFYPSMDACFAESEPNVILFSGVLQVLENPYELLEQINATKCRVLIIDRTPFWNGASDRLCVLRVPAAIYSASYPCWIFSAQRFRSVLGREWDVFTVFSSVDHVLGPVPLRYEGLIALKRTGSEHSSAA